MESVLLECCCWTYWNTYTIRNAFLSNSTALLSAEELLIVSLPNVANIATRLMLLFGCFDYVQRGIHDRTYHWFFTRPTAWRLLETNGYSIVEEKHSVIPIELVLRLSTGNVMLQMPNRMLAFATWMMPGLFGHQVMFVARSKLDAVRSLAEQRITSVTPAEKTGE